MKALVVVGIIGSIASLASFLSEYHRIFDLLSHFRIQFVVLVGLAFCLALLAKRYVASLILMVCLSLHIFDAWRYQTPIETTANVSSGTIRIMTSNLQVGNKQREEHLAHIRDVKPDLVVFQEYTYEWQTFINEKLSDYPHSIEVPNHHAFGIALYSKLPIDESEVLYFIRDTRKSIEVSLSINDQKLRVIGTHPPPPLSSGLYQARNQHLLKLAAMAMRIEEPVVVVGDLNVSTWSKHFQKFLTAGQLVDARRGHGILPTWPNSTFLLQIPIDHILLKGDLSATSMQAGQELGSDHKSLWADIKLH